MEAFGHLARNIAVLTAADVVARLASAAFVAVAARRLGAEGYGLYATALTFLLFARLLSRFGLQGAVFVRDVAEHRALAARYLTSALLLSLAPSLLVWAALPWVARALGYHEALPALLASLGAALVGHAIARPAEDVLRAFEQMPLLSAASVAVSLGTAGLGIGLLLLGAGLEALMGLQVLAAWVEAGLLVGLVHRHAAPLRWDPSTETLRRLAREGLVLSLVVALDLLSTRIDVLILARVHGPDAAGLYAPAVRLVEVVLLLRAGAGAALYPYLAARWQGSIVTLGRAYQNALRVFAMYGIGGAVALTAGAETLVRLVFGAAYLPAAAALRILAWAMVADLLSGPVVEVVFVSRQPLARFMPGLAGLAALNVGLNAWLVPRWAHVGAALAALLTAVAGLGLRVSWVRRTLRDAPPSLGAAAWRPMAAGLAMAGVALALAPLGPWLALPAALACYVALLAALGAFRPDELAWARETLRRGLGRARG